MATESLQSDLLKTIRRISLDREMADLAEKLRQEIEREVDDETGKELENQDIKNSIEVVKGSRPGQYLVASRGDCGRNREFGTRNSPELPWFIPAFVKVSGSSRNCLHGALQRALLKARRHHVSG